jgi:predicted transposase YbfD/YdcC
LLAAAMLAGQESILAMSEWVSENGELFVEALQPRRRMVPSYATLRRALCLVGVEAVERCVSSYTQALDADDRVSGQLVMRDGGMLRGQAVDGKTLRGASAHGDKVHLVSIVRHESGAVLAQAATEAGIDEPKAAKALLADFSLEGTVTTMDALYTERPLTQQILNAGGDYFMVVKRNQQILYRDIELAFSALPPTSSWEHDFWGYDEHATVEQKHGRSEVRRLERTTALNDYLDWPNVGQVLRRTYRRIEGHYGLVSQEVRYAVTSLTPEQIAIEQLAQLWRWHWTIENRTHYVRDVSLGEDRCQVRSHNAPQVLAAFRNLVVTALRLEGWPRIKTAVRHFANSPQHTLHFMGVFST